MYVYFVVMILEIASPICSTVAGWHHIEMCSLNEYVNCLIIVTADGQL